MTATDDLFWPYLLPILEEQKTENGITYIQMSDSNGMDRMLTDSRSEDVYPGIYVLRPTYAGSMVDNSLMIARFNLTLFTFIHSKMDEYSLVDAAFAKAEKTIGDIIKRLQHDRFSWKNYMDFDSIRIEPVMYMSGVDAACGYELNMKLGLPANEIFC